MFTNLDDQAIEGFKRILDMTPGWLHEIVGAPDTEIRVKLARHIIRELAMLQETLVHYAGQDEYGQCPAFVSNIMELLDDDLTDALHAYQDRMGEIRDSKLRINLGARL
jgi:hypothetical protein